MRLMRRSLCDIVSHDQWEFLRVRDEGSKVTLTFKEFDSNKELLVDSTPEIEGSTEAPLQDVAQKLALDWQSAIFGGVMAAYCVQYSHIQLGENVGDIPSVRFGDPLPSLLQP